MKLLCKYYDTNNKYFKLTVGKYYDVSKKNSYTLNGDDDGCEWFFFEGDGFPQIWDYFYTEQETRRIKLLHIETSL